MRPERVRWRLSPAGGFRAGPTVASAPPVSPALLSSAGHPEAISHPLPLALGRDGPATTGFEQKPHFRAHTSSPCLPCCRSPRDVALTCQTTRRHGFTPQSASSPLARASACRPPRGVLRARRCLPGWRRPPWWRRP